MLITASECMSVIFINIQKVARLISIMKVVILKPDLSFSKIIQEYSEFNLKVSKYHEHIDQLFQKNTFKVKRCFYTFWCLLFFFL